MSDHKPVRLSGLHQDVEIFRESVNFTAGKTGFSAILVEKDYFCTLLLSYLQERDGSQLIFKGGTSLSKVFFDFYRLSEDLDFIIPMPIDAKRGERSAQMANLKKAIASLPKEHPVFLIKEDLEGRHNSRQYIATIGYKSILDGRSETIKLEIGLREPVLRPIHIGDAKTLLVNAANSHGALSPLELSCLSLEEAMAEKFRAALTRREVAIRDFYDIEHAASRAKMNYDTEEFLGMVRKKLAVPGNDPPDMSEERLAALRDQLEARLKPVLREQDYKAFDLNKAIELVEAIHQKL